MLCGGSTRNVNVLCRGQHDTFVLRFPTLFYSLKGQRHEIFDHFFAQKIRPRPHMNRQKRFHELFHFREDIRSQSSKICDYADTQIFLSIQRFTNF